MKKADYNYKEIEPYVMGTPNIGRQFSFHIGTYQAPSEGEILEIDGHGLYLVDAVVEDTTDEEWEQGFNYSKVCMCIYEED